MNESDDGFEPLFNGHDLSGWVVQPRQYGPVYPGGPDVTEVLTVFPSNYNELAAEHPAAWTVEDGTIVGRQDAPGSGWGGYLVTEEKYGDFELRLEMKPDWPADTGVMIRRRFDSWDGLQVLVDHRQSGSIGGFFGNGLGSFHAVPFALTAKFDESGTAVALKEDDPETSVEPFEQSKADMLDFAGDVTAFLDAWKWNDWNSLTIRCVGEIPRVTTWVNGVKVAEIDLATLEAPDYVAGDVAELLGSSGHIALEVHDNDPMLGDGRWAPGAACRWRDLRIKSL
ncbi:3-keto-disaccharide hydrolase [Subtercola frigoramans]|uniref:3-keto-alpha-glucoside-1,2-lyase/3-keto-2-hydroxy-glucal hydratase domain-containing protein n=1 Tax=Subtercola frigoramans TaxID=120298 RepID=A0ABS2L079_9MICO|nr:DUF1080 domain-containing protein [Subtercola frigoramans]MBM7470486.1 hypothetical protein [Subtercola frigoramans]